jgi:crotonobetaine/carnitine-CoA ligase
MTPPSPPARDQILPHRVALHAAGPLADTTFLQEVDGPSLTYAQTHERALGWAQFFRDLGVEPQTPVASMLPTRLPVALTWLGLGWCRAINVGINTELRGNLLGYVLSNSTARILVTAERFYGEIAAVLDQAPNIELIVVVDGDPDSEAAAALGLPVIAAPGDDARATDTFEGPEIHELGAVLYTSGTTGPSKGVRMPWGHLLATALASIPAKDLGPDDVMYTPYAMHHVTGRTSLYMIALAGGCCVLREHFKTDRFWADVEQYGCTTSVLMGIMADFLYRQPGPDPFATPMRNMMITPLVPQIEEFKRRFGVRVCSCFNMTETSVPVATPDWELFNTTCAGRVRPGAEVRIVDEHDQEVPHGEVGEIIVRTDQPWTMNDGYWGMPEKTAEAWRNLWFHSGDAGRRDEDGNFWFVDRIKDAIRRRGVNISSMELEREVMANLEVQEVAAVGVPSEHMEEEVKIVVVRAPGSTITARELSDFLEERVPRFMRPRYIEFADALPKTPTHKVQKMHLREAGNGPTTWDRLEGQTHRLAAST